VETIVQQPADMRALLVLAHGAGAGMRHDFLEQQSALLAGRGIGTLRYEFAYMEQKRNRVDPPAVAVARVREAVAEARRLAPGVPLFAGGKSFGGRMTSTAQSEAPLPGVRGLVFYGFPLHPPPKPGIERATHLAQVRVPMLFLQGTRDEFAQLELLRPMVAGLGALATLELLEGGDHSFKAPKSAGRSAAEIRDWLADMAVSWMTAQLG